MSWRFKGSLRGMSLKQYTAVERFKPSTVVLRARKYVDRHDWIKFDRRKPMTEDQIHRVSCAINKAMLELVNNFPFETPTFKFVKRAVVGYKNKKICELVSADLFIVPYVSTPDGAAYQIGKKKVFTHTGFSGPITFSGHAIERLLERIPDLNSLCRTEFAASWLVLLKKAVADQQVDKSTLTLSLLGLGHFPMVWEPLRDIWVCTTFLLPKFAGTPEDAAEKLRKLREKWA